MPHVPSSSLKTSTLDVDGQYTLQAREIFVTYAKDDLYRQVVVATIDAKDASKLLKLLTERMNLSQYDVRNTTSFASMRVYFVLVFIYPYNASSHASIPIMR